MLKKWLIWVAIGFVVFFVAFRPGMAVDVVSTLGRESVTIFTGVGKFFESLAD